MHSNQLGLTLWKAHKGAGSKNKIVMLVQRTYDSEFQRFEPKQIFNLKLYNTFLTKALLYLLQFLRLQW